MVKETKKTPKKATKKVEPKAEKKAEKKAVKKTVAKKAVKAAVAKKATQDYIDAINEKKWGAHNLGWLYIELNAGDLMEELEPGVANLKTVVDAMHDMMLEGDDFLVRPDKASKKLAVRYYCDNLHPSRRKYADVNH